MSNKYVVTKASQYLDNMFFSRDLNILLNKIQLSLQMLHILGCPTIYTGWRVKLYYLLKIIVLKTLFPGKT